MDGGGGEGDAVSATGAGVGGAADDMERQLVDEFGDDGAGEGKAGGEVERMFLLRCHIALMKGDVDGGSLVAQPDCITMSVASSWSIRKVGSMKCLC